MVPLDTKIQLYYPKKLMERWCHFLSSELHVPILHNDAKIRGAATRGTKVPGPSLHGIKFEIISQKLASISKSKLKKRKLVAVYKTHKNNSLDEIFFTYL